LGGQLRLVIACIVAFARDPQLEHGKAELLVPPQKSCVLKCMCCGSAYRYTCADFAAGVPKRNPACLRKYQTNGKMDGATLIAASIVAAIRLRGEEIKPSPKLTAAVNDAVHLARLVLAELERRR
jgi:hypothetical protein